MGRFQRIISGMNKIGLTKRLLLFLSFILFGLFLYTFFASTIYSSTETISFTHLLVLLLLGATAYLITSNTIKAFSSTSFLEDLINRINKLWTKKGRFQFITDLILIFSIISAFLIYSRYKYFGFLELIWAPLPYYVAAAIPYLVGFLALSVTTITLFMVISFDEKDVSKLIKNALANFAISISIFIIVTAIYRGSAAYVGKTNSPALAYFPQLAESFSKGLLFIEKTQSIKDLTFYEGKYYVSFPPLGALLMLPKVASSSRFGVNTIQFSIIYSALTSVVLYLLLQKLRFKKYITLNKSSLIWLVVLYSIGTSQWYMSTTGAVWHVAQLLGTFFLAFSILLTLSFENASGWDLFRSAVLSGLSLGIAMLSRPHLGFSWFFLLSLVYQTLKENHTFTWRRFLFWLILSAIPMSLAVSGIGWYNYIRFGSVADFGYSYMLVGPEIINSLKTYGQFHPRYIWGNLKANWFGLPYWHEGCRRLAPDPKGMSIFLTTPNLLFITRSWEKKPWVIGAWISIISIVITHLLYFNTGAQQFGYRFSLDFLVIAFCLLSAGLKDKIPTLFKYLVFYSALINFIGVLWNAKQWCLTW
jgi:hypothetical protein